MLTFLFLFSEKLRVPIHPQGGQHAHSHTAADSRRGGAHDAGANIRFLSVRLDLRPQNSIIHAFPGAHTIRANLDRRPLTHCELPPG